GTALYFDRVLVRGYGSATIYRVEGDGLEAENDVVLPEQQQGETVAYLWGEDAVLVGSEGVRQPLWWVQVPAPELAIGPGDGRTLSATKVTEAGDATEESASAAASWTPFWAA